MREPIVICEGVGVFSDSFDEFKPVRIYMEIHEELRQQRLSERDTPRPDRSATEWQKIQEIWSTAEAEYFSSERIEKADLVIDHDTEIKRICDFIHAHEAIAQGGAI
jgi:uridine kinase